MVLEVFGGQAQWLLGLVERALLFVAAKLATTIAEEKGIQENENCAQNDYQNAHPVKLIFRTNANIFAKLVEVMFHVIEKATAGSEVGNRVTLGQGLKEGHHRRIVGENICIKRKCFERDGL